MAERSATAAALIDRVTSGADDAMKSDDASLLVPRDDVGRKAAGPPARMVNDELAGVVASVCARFPGHPRAEVEVLVTDVYRRLKASAKITTHLIPLTLNLTLRLMREAADPAIA
jgi:hypothetical protein